MAKDTQAKSEDQQANQEVVKPLKNPGLVHMNGRILYRSVQRNTVFCGVLSAVFIVVSVWLFNTGTASMAVFTGLMLFSVISPFFLLAYLLKICFIDGAMGALIIRGNQNKPIEL